MNLYSKPLDSLPKRVQAILNREHENSSQYQEKTISELMELGYWVQFGMDGDIYYLFSVEVSYKELKAAEAFVSALEIEIDGSPVWIHNESCIRLAEAIKETVQNELCV